MEYIAGSNDFSVGKKNRIIELDDHIRILPVICYEILFFWILMNDENFNSNIIINITNDSWFGNFSGPYQHFYFTRLRAAEFNKPLIRVSNNGISAVIDNYGNIIEYIGLNKQQTKISKLRILDKQYNYLKFHKYILYFIFLFFLTIFLVDRKYDSRKP